MKPGSLIEVKPHRLLPGRYVWEEPILNPDIRVDIEPFQLLMILEWNEHYCKLLLNDRVCYLHESLVNLTNFRPLDAPMFEAM
jgi:hypothetical protein